MDGSSSSAKIDRVDFTRADLLRVQSFSCGDQPWEQYIDDYLKSAGLGGAIAQAERFGNSAWLYFLDGQLIGYGVLGMTRWRWPDPKDKTQYQHVVAFGVDKRFQGLPEGPREQRYSWRLFLDIMSEAQKKPSESRLLTLFVDERNQKAVRFYNAFLFDDVPEIRIEEDGNNYLGMAVKLPDSTAPHGA